MPNDTPQGQIPQQDLSNPSTPPDSSQTSEPAINQTPTTEQPSPQIEQPIISQPDENPQTPETSKEETQPEQQSTQQDTQSQTPQQPEPTENPQPDISNIPQLHFPFAGSYPTTFAFGAVSDNEEIKNKFTQWGIVGHNGIDFGLPTGIEVFPCATGTVIQSGENGDFGISITIQHSWGSSLYAHLSETKVNVNDTVEPNKVIGKSGSTGSAFGEHLHFAIKPNNPDESNGYLGFIDPTPYLSLPSQKQEEPQSPEIPQNPQPNQQEPTQQISESPPVQESPQPVQPVVIPPPINYGKGPSAPVQIPETPEIPQFVSSPISPQQPVASQVDLKSLLQKANQERQMRREENLGKIEKLIEEKKQTTNAEVCDLLHISRSTAIEYLHDLVQRGRIKSSGKAKATVYTF